MNAETSNISPLIISFVDDLMFATRIETTVDKLGFRFLSQEELPKLRTGDIDGFREPAGEPITGPDSRPYQELIDLQPSLLIFDLGSNELNWRHWITLLKSSPATRRIPILCFGPHIDKDRLEEAKKLSAEIVVARSKFALSMPELIKQNLRQWNATEIADACQSPLSELAVRGLEAFNMGHYFESHELLEDAWNEEEGPVRELYRAILQIAVAYLQIERENYRGAIKMFLRAKQWLKPLPSTCRGINIEQLVSDADRTYRAVIELGPDAIHQFDPDLLMPVQFEIVE